MRTPNTTPQRRRPKCRAALWLAIGVIVFVADAFAQPVVGLDPRLEPTQYVHTAWTVDDGLPQNSVYAVEQGPGGYLWLGTQAGLVQFDGVRFSVYDRKHGLANNKVRAILVRGDSSLWLGTNGGGLSRFENGFLTTYTTDDGLPSDYILTLFEDREGVLWAGTIDGGLARFDGSGFTTFTDRDGLAGNVVLAIDEAPNGDLLVGTQAGLSVLRGDRFTTYTTAGGLPGDLVWDLERDSHGGIWVGTSGGLAYFYGGRVDLSLTERDGLCGQTVSALHQDPAGTLWIGTLGNGICRYVDGRFIEMSSIGNFTNDRVRTFATDAEGNLWIGTESGGLNRLRQGKFTHLSQSEGLSSDMAVTVTSAAGDMWIGTKSAGLSHVASGRVRNFSIEGELPSDQVYALHTAGDELWVGMYQGGVCRLHDRRFTCYDREDGLRSNNVFAIYEDAGGIVWIGTDAGISLLKNGHISGFDREEKLSHEPITVIHQDRSGAMWIGSFGGGLTRIRDNEITRLTGETGFVDASVLALHEDAAGALWAGTHGAGLCRIRGDSSACISSHDGLPSDDVVQVVTDDLGGLWIGTQHAIARISREAAHDFLDGRRSSVEVVRYNGADGLKSTELNGGTQPSAWKSDDGRLWFATNHGVATIDPSAIQTNPIPPAVHLETMNANGEPIALGDDTSLSAGTKDLHIRYTGISLTAPEEVRFKYRLEGYDAGWVDAKTRREAYYTNLAPGEYTFRVIAANNDGVWNEEGDSVTFYLEPFFYQTWWFNVLCILAAIGLAFLAFRLRIRQMKARERELEDQVEARTRDLRREKERTEEAKLVIEGQADQLRDLNQDLEDQAEKLRDLNENLQAKVQEQFALLVQERERYEADLIDAKERAEASDRLKTAILNNLSHEFRTPLTAILGFTEIIAMEAPADLQEFTGEIDRGGKRLLRTLDALLEFSRLEADESGMSPTSVDLTTTAFSVVRDLKKVAEHKNLPLHFKATSPVRAHLDAGALEEIVWNLVDNAIKFTHDGSVEVTTGTDGDRAFICVSDTGVGIGEDFRERMYDAFAQESDGYDRAFEGVGLGLTITRRLVEHMGGEIEVDSVVDGGSTFTVYFPVREFAAT